MAQVLITESYLDDIADAIREKNGSEDTYTPAQMAGAINGIHTADEVVLVSKSVTANGTYNPASDSADGYSGVTVNVPNTYTVSDNGKVVVNQALTDQTSKSINANGTHDTTANNSVVVDVPNSYGAADEGKVVSSGELVAQTSRNVSQNGTYDTTLNNEVVVNVQGGGGGDNDEILYNPDLSKNTTGQTSWDGTNSGSSQTSRMRIIDGWEIMQCTAEKVSSGLKVVPKMQYAYLTATIPAYWFLGKTVTIYAVVNGTKYEMTGVLSSNGASVSYNTPFGQLYFYAYNRYDIVFTLSFNNQINQEFVISDTSMKLSTSS